MNCRHGQLATLCTLELAARRHGAPLRLAGGRQAASPDCGAAPAAGPGPLPTAAAAAAA